MQRVKLFFLEKDYEIVETVPKLHASNRFFLDDNVNLILMKFYEYENYALNSLINNLNNKEICFYVSCETYNYSIPLKTPGNTIEEYSSFFNTDGYLYRANTVHKENHKVLIVDWQNQVDYEKLYKTKKLLGVN